METVKAKTNLALMTVAAAGALVATEPAMAEKSPYEPLAANGSAELVLKEDPAKNEELLGLLTKFKRTNVIEKLQTLNPSQRERVAGYYKLIKASGANDRVVSQGVSGVIMGFAEIADVRGFVEEYKSTGKALKSVPLPYANFKGSAEKFPGATEYLLPELESSKKLDDQINAVLDLIAAENRQATEKLREQIKFLDNLLKGMK